MERPRHAPKPGHSPFYLPHALTHAGTPWFVSKPNWRFTAVLVADLMLVFVVMPLFSAQNLHLIGPLMMVLIASGTIVLVSDRPAVRAGVLAVLLLAAVSYALPEDFSGSTASALGAICAALMAIFVGRAVFARGVVDAHRIAGAIALYLNVSLAFAATYALISDISPAAFSGLTPDRAGRVEDMIHFSLTTLTTVGYGDILPRSPLARSIADLEALIGQLFPATLLARLVGLQISSRQSGADRGL